MMKTTPLTEDDWKLIQAAIAEGPPTTYLDTTDEGTCVIFAGGIMHPAAYLDIITDDPGEPAAVDILKQVPQMPGSLLGRNIKPFRP